MKKKIPSNWKNLKVHPLLHRHIMGSPILAPMASAAPQTDGEEAGEIPGQPDPDDVLPRNAFGK
jgi:hypothetical protein